MRVRAVVGILVATLTATEIVWAECLKDVRGQVVCGQGPCVTNLQGAVFCARSRYAAVVRTMDGATLCGKGQCASTLKGAWICSAVADGSVFKDWDGSIRCEGSCEPASVANCQTSPLSP